MYKNNVVQIKDSDKNDADNIDFKPYMKSLQKKIKSNWHPIHSNESKRIVVLFKINKNGTLEKLKIYKPSGNASLDKEALDAVLRSTPFDSLPKEFKGNSIDIQFTFDYNVFDANNYSDNKNSSGYQKIVEAIISHSLPKRLSFRDKCLVLRITIEKNGKLESVQVIHSSKDKNFDNLYVSAVKKCSFPTFPDSLNSEKFSMDYIVQVKRSDYAEKHPFYYWGWFFLGMLAASHAI